MHTNQCMINRSVICSPNMTLKKECEVKSVAGGGMGFTYDTSNDLEHID